MSETLIIAAIIAPLMLVPAIIVSFMSHVDDLSWPHTEMAWPVIEESQFVLFHREMMNKIVASLGIPKELLEEPLEPVGYSSFAESLKCYRRFGGWL
ncbi:hypothetical protein [Paraburkholderia sediminicola]|uniref:hypothetical protein n=1 Tax=Paraburkholderia sediminicola TaxID=458836 RepID=UPI0038B9EB29